MTNILFESLNIELTRRCNQRCAHCYKGDPQDIDMSDEIIDALLDRTSAIFSLSFAASAEVTLCPDRMRYFLEGCKQRNVVILRLEFTTNGTIRSQEMLDIIKDYHNYIADLIGVPCDDKFIYINVSFDDYHNAEDSQNGFDFYKNNLKDIAVVQKLSTGDVPYAIGRAKSLPYALKDFPTYTKDADGLKKIQYMTEQHKPICPQRYTRQVYNEQQIYIPCNLRMSVYGHLLDSSRNMDNDAMDDVNHRQYLCDIHIDDNSDLITAIEKYNEGKPYCDCNLIQSPEISDISKIFKGVEFIMYCKRYASKHPHPEEYFNRIFAKIITQTCVVFEDYSREKATAMAGITSDDVVNEQAERYAQHLDKQLNVASDPQSIKYALNDIGIITAKQEKELIYEYHMAQLKQHKLYPGFYQIAKETYPYLTEEELEKCTLADIVLLGIKHDKMDEIVPDFGGKTFMEIKEISQNIKSLNFKRKHEHNNVK